MYLSDAEYQQVLKLACKNTPRVLENRKLQFEKNAKITVLEPDQIVYARTFSQSCKAKGEMAKLNEKLDGPFRVVCQTGKNTNSYLLCDQEGNEVTLHISHIRTE